MWVINLCMAYLCYDVIFYNGYCFEHIMRWYLSSENDGEIFSSVELLMEIDYLRNETKMVRYIHLHSMINMFKFKLFVKHLYFSVISRSSKVIHDSSSLWWIPTVRIHGSQQAEFTSTKYILFYYYCTEHK